MSRKKKDYIAINVSIDSHQNIKDIAEKTGLSIRVVADNIACLVFDNHEDELMERLSKLQKPAQNKAINPDVTVSCSGYCMRLRISKSACEYFADKERLFINASDKAIIISTDDGLADIGIYNRAITRRPYKDTMYLNVEFAKSELDKKAIPLGSGRYMLEAFRDKYFRLIEIKGE